MDKLVCPCFQHTRLPARLRRSPARQCLSGGDGYLPACTNSGRFGQVSEISLLKKGIVLYIKADRAAKLCICTMVTCPVIYQSKLVDRIIILIANDAMTLSKNMAITL